MSTENFASCFHLAVSDVPYEKISHCVSGDGSGLTALTSVDEVNHCSANDEMVVADQPAPQPPRRNAQHLVGSIELVFSRCLVSCTREDASRPPRETVPLAGWRAMCASQCTAVVSYTDSTSAPDGGTVVTLLSLRLHVISRNEAIFWGGCS